MITQEEAEKLADQFGDQSASVYDDYGADDYYHGFTSGFLKACEYFNLIDFEYAVYRQSITHVNLELAKKQRLTSEDIGKIQKLQNERFFIRNQIESGDIKPTKEIGKKLTEIDNELVNLWRFDKSKGSYYKYWEEPGCTCPSETLPYFIHHCNIGCPLHGVE